MNDIYALFDFEKGLKRQQRVAADARDRAQLGGEQSSGVGLFSVAFVGLVHVAQLVHAVQLSALQDVQPLEGEPLLQVESGHGGRACRRARRQGQEASEKRLV